MFLEKSSKKMKGYMKLSIFGFFIERFLNLAMNANIKIWNIQKKDDATLILCCDPSGYKKLIPIASKTGCKITICRKEGMPFFVMRHRKRPTFPILCILIMIGIYYYHLHIWQINIVGDFTFPIEDIQKELEMENIKVGVLKNSIDTSYAKNNIYMRRHDIAWIGISYKGTSCTVEIVEANLKSEENEMDTIPCNIVADKEGVIYSINTLEGIPLVKSGDTVQKGDVLISGVIISNDSPKRLVNAKGEVYIKRWYTNKTTVLLEKDLVSHTGRTQNEYQMQIQNYKINLGNIGTNFEKYDTIMAEECLNLFGVINLPIKFFKTMYREIDVETVQYTEKQAIELATFEMEHALERKINHAGQVIHKEIKTSKNENHITVVITIECIEKVGVKKKLEE